MASGAVEACLARLERLGTRLQPSDSPGGYTRAVQRELERMEAEILGEPVAEALAELDARALQEREERRECYG